MVTAAQLFAWVLASTVSASLVACFLIAELKPDWAHFQEEQPKVPNRRL
jgi:hypothetical protein